MSNGVSARGPWNEGQGPWENGERWTYVEDPHVHVVQTRGLLDEKPGGTSYTASEIRTLDKALSKERSAEVTIAAPPGQSQRTKYPTEDLMAPVKVDK